MLIWLDLETTGLDPFKDYVLEVGAIATDDDFNEVARYASTIGFYSADYIVRRFAYLDFMKIDGEQRAGEIESLSRRLEISPLVLEMHWKNGLWIDSVKADKSAGLVDDELAAFVTSAHRTDEEGKTHMPQLAGSTISFDRAFLRGNGDDFSFPKSLAALHYRNLDVSSFNEVARRKWPALYAARPNNETKAHRGMADIEESIRVLKHYLNHLEVKP